MAPKHHPTPLSGGDRKALNKELGKSRVNGGLPWLKIQCARCKAPSDVDLAAMKHPPTTFVHDLASRLRCRKCAKAGRHPSATLLQLGWQPRHPQGDV
jgi:hypothetical protein